MIDTSMKISQEQRLIQDGSRTFKLTSSRGITNSDQEVPHIVIANGWVAGSSLYRRFVRSLIAAAGGALAVTTYEDPLVGSSAYAQSYRTERLTQSVRYVSKEQPVSIMGHSRGWISTTEAGQQLVSEQRLQGLIGLTPMPQLAAHNDDPFGLLKRLALEVLHAPRSLTSLGALATNCLLVTRGLVHAGVKPAATAREIHSLMIAPTARETAQLSMVLPLCMIAGSSDALVPPEVLKDSLDNVGYRGSFATISASHLGALIDYRRTSDIYSALHDSKVL